MASYKHPLLGKRGYGRIVARLCKDNAFSILQGNPFVGENVKKEPVLEEVEKD